MYKMNRDSYNRTATFWTETYAQVLLCTVDTSILGTEVCTRCGGAAVVVVVAAVAAPAGKSSCQVHVYFGFYLNYLSTQSVMVFNIPGSNNTMRSSSTSKNIDNDIAAITIITLLLVVIVVIILIIIIMITTVTPLTRRQCQRQYLLRCQVRDPEGNEDVVKRVCDMGFPEPQARRALASNDWDENAAINALLSGS